MSIFESFAWLKSAFVHYRVNPEQKCLGHFAQLFVSAVISKI